MVCRPGGRNCWEMEPDRCTGRRTDACAYHLRNHVTTGATTTWGYIRGKGSQLTQSEWRPSAMDKPKTTKRGRQGPSESKRETEARASFSGRHRVTGEEAAVNQGTRTAALLEDTVTVPRVKAALLPPLPSGSSSPPQSTSVPALLKLTTPILAHSWRSEI